MHFVSALLSQFVDSQLTIGLLGITGAIVTASIQYRAARDKETDARLFSEKQKVYMDLIETIMGLFHNAKDKGAPLNEAAFVKRLQDIRTKLLVWGSFDTIRTLDKLGETSLDADGSADPSQGLIWLGELMGHIRRDLGHKDPNEAGAEIALGILIPEDRAKLRAGVKKSR